MKIWIKIKIYLYLYQNKHIFLSPISFYLQREKNKFVCLKDGYHGDTLGAVSVGGIDIFHSTFNPLLFESIKISSYDSTSKVLDDFRKLLIKDANQIAALY